MTTLIACMQTLHKATEEVCGQVNKQDLKLKHKKKKEQSSIDTSWIKKHTPNLTELMKK